MKKFTKILAFVLILTSCLGAFVACDNSSDSKVLAVIDARHENYYVQKFIEGKPLKAEFVTFDELKELSNGFTVLSSTLTYRTSPVSSCGTASVVTFRSGS